MHLQKRFSSEAGLINRLKQSPKCLETEWNFQRQPLTTAPSLVLVKTCFLTVATLTTSWSRVARSPYFPETGTTLITTSLTDSVNHKWFKRPHCSHTTKVTTFTNKPVFLAQCNPYCTPPYLPKYCGSPTECKIQIIQLLQLGISNNCWSTEQMLTVALSICLNVRDLILFWM